MAMELVPKEEVLLKMNLKRVSSRYAKLTLEDYVQFFDTRSFSDFSINYLNQIIAMHGYKRIHKTPKKVLIEAMSAIALTNPSRSTLNEKICPSWEAETVESVIKDLSELNWQECTITSVESIGSGCNNRSLTVASSSSAATDGAPKRRRGKNKAKRIPLKPKGNEMVSASGEAKRSKRKAKRKKLCDCKGCVLAVDL